MLKKGHRIYHREHNVQAMLHMCYSWKFQLQINLLLLRSEVKTRVLQILNLCQQMYLLYTFLNKIYHILYLHFFFIAAATIPLKKKKPSFCRNEQAKTMSDSFKFSPFTSALMSEEAFLSPTYLYQRDIIL